MSIFDRIGSGLQTTSSTLSDINKGAKLRIGQEFGNVISGVSKMVGAKDTRKWAEKKTETLTKAVEPTIKNKTAGEIGGIGASIGTTIAGPGKIFKAVRGAGGALKTGAALFAGGQAEAIKSRGKNIGVIKDEETGKNKFSGTTAGLDVVSSVLPKAVSKIPSGAVKTVQTSGKLSNVIYKSRLGDLDDTIKKVYPNANTADIATKYGLHGKDLSKNAQKLADEGTSQVEKVLSPYSSNKINIPTITNAKGKVVPDINKPLGNAISILKSTGDGTLLKNYGTEAVNLKNKLNSGNATVKDVHDLKSLLGKMTYSTGEGGVKIKNEGVAEAHKKLSNQLEKLLGPGYREGNKKIQLGVSIGENVAKNKGYSQKMALGAAGTIGGSAAAYGISTGDWKGALTYGGTAATLPLLARSPTLRTKAANVLYNKVGKKGIMETAKGEGLLSKIGKAKDVAKNIKTPTKALPAAGMSSYNKKIVLPYGTVGKAPKANVTIPSTKSVIQMAQDAAKIKQAKFKASNIWNPEYASIIPKKK